MIRTALLLAPILLLPHLASAQTIVVEPRLEAIAQAQLSALQQQLAILQQQLAVLNNIQAIEQSKVTAPMANAAFAYAGQQGAVQTQARTAAATPPAQ